MPLSEHEERILAEIERRLSEEDPRFVQRARKAVTRDRRVTRARLAAVGFALGLVLLLGITFHIALGVAGFAVMFASILVGAGAVRGDAGSGGALRERVRRAFGGRDHAR